LAPKAYTHLAALKGQVLYCTQDEDGKNDLHAYDLKQLKEDLWVSSIESFSFSLDRQWMVYKSNGRLRTLRAGSKPDDGPDTSFHQGGWLDWTRVVLMTHPQKEWIHMFDEAWRLQKEMFWMPSMGKIDWQEVYERYRPCVDQITCQSEIYSVISDMQGELGTSHAYVMAHGKSKDSTLGSLGADFSFSPEHGAYRIDKFLQGDLWSDLPLQRPGLGLSQGDLIWAIGGQNLSQEIHPCHGLIQQSGNSVPIVVSNSLGENKRTLVVFPKSASKDHKWRYRQWVETNRQWVHKNSNGLVGYIHIPDMGPFGYSEFLRGYTQEFDRDGLIIDARYNGGGNLSYFMIDVLRRKRLGYDQSRHQGLFPYPGDSPKGPMVALVNEYTGSDGDIFSHAFKALDMGPLIGKRTWGGVVGIWPRYDLIDGTRTSQPEYSFWFHDIGWCVENTGVSPTIEVDITPQDYGQNRDPQLARGLEEVQLRILQDMARQEGLLPASGVEPCLAPPMNLGSKGSAD
jgi:tricorn protease